MRKMIALLLTVCLAATAAGSLGESISFSGKVEASETREVYAPVSGTAEEVPVRAGQSVTADTVIAKLKTTKVYAPENGTITSVYGQPGDDAATVAAAYGAVMYLEGETIFHISATAEGAAEVRDNFIIHSGETLYIVSRNHTLNKGTGLVTAVEESGFTVRVASGKFYVGDSVDIFRDSDYTPTSRVGRGTIQRLKPTAISGTGSIVSYAVQPGDSVQRGQLLFETIEGGFDGLEMTGTEIRAGVDGIIASLNVQQGGNVTKNSVVAVIYPKNAVWVAASVSEGDLLNVTEGMKVQVELDWNQDLGVTYEGTVEMISALSGEGTGSASYPVYVSFLPDEHTRYGMSALITTPGEEEPEEEPEEEAAAETENPPAEKEEPSQNTETGEANEREGRNRPDGPSAENGEKPQRENGTERGERTEGSDASDGK